MSYILQTNHLTKTIGGKTLVRDINLHVKKGEIYGFLGPERRRQNHGYEADYQSVEAYGGNGRAFRENTYPKVL